MNGALAPARYELPSISCITLAMADSLRLYGAAPLALQGGLLPLRHRHKFAPPGSGKELSRAADLLIGIRDQLAPLRAHTHGARQGEDRREHRDRNAERLVDDAGVEIHVRIELALDEILVLERDLLQRDGELEQLVVLEIELFQHLVAGLLDDLGARVVVLVDAVTETHQHRMP